MRLRFLFFIFVAAGLAAQTPSKNVTVHPVTGALIFPDAATFKSANGIGSGGGAADGAVLYGVGVPSAGAGNNGDTYIRTDSSGGTYYKTGGVWVLEITWVGSGDARLSDARTPTSHTHPASEISDSTTVGRSWVTTANPSAIRYPRVNANNTVSYLTAAEFLTDIGGGTGGGDFSSNTSTSVADEFILFSNTTGKTGKRATGTGLARAASGVASFSELSGDATTSGSNAVTVRGLNGVTLSGLATGILKNSTSTGVPVIAAAGTDYVAPGGSAGAIDVTTQAADTNSTKAASTAYVVGQAASATPAMDGSAAVGTSLRYARGDHVHPSDTSKANAANGAHTGSTTYEKLTPNITALGTITNGSTATLTNSAQVYTATFSGATATIALPSSPTNGLYTLHGTSTSGSALTLTIPSLIRPEYDLDSPIATITVPATSTGLFTVQFTALAAAFTKVSAVGDALAPTITVSATDRLLGRDTAGAGAAEELTVSGGLEFTGSGGIQRSALTGDVTASAGSGSTTIANDAVGNAKLANVSTNTIKGRVTASAGDPEDLTPAQGLTVLESGGTNIIVSTEIDTSSEINSLTTDDDFATLTGSQTLTNKKITPRVQSLTDAATVTPDLDLYDGGVLLTLSQTTTIANATGTIVNGKTYWIRIKSTTARALSLGTMYRGSSDLALPSTTSGGGLTDYFLFIGNTADSKLDLLAQTKGF